MKTNTFKILVLMFIWCALMTYGCKDRARAELTDPDFTLQSISGDSVSLKQFSGKVVLLDFWATWCPPCRQSIPELVEIQGRYRHKGLVILGISVDDPGMVNDDYLRAFSEKFKMNYRVLRGSENVIRDFFGTREFPIPTMFIIDSDGKIVKKMEGFRPGLLEKTLKALIQ
ncbi:MAG: TlpA family protein disulfide reductase [Deltaproteobacteria bacterium]|nr:TlpA family protein disulfide reductase [Deltaproteobacteria bacterium]